MQKLPTDPYKGVRDFYPEDMAVQNYIFSTWKKAVEKFGYQEYSASVLEPAELYRAKSGEEIVNDQTYTFTDRGDREVTLRPEMTPTVARLVAAKKRDLGFPLRWYSIPNLFRYEQPQRGRLREHWQLNVDLFGVASAEAEREGVTVSQAIMAAFGAKPEHYEIRVNNRKLLNALYTKLDLNKETSHKVSKLIDKKGKMDSTAFEAALKEVIGEKCAQLAQILSYKSVSEFASAAGVDHNAEWYGEFAALIKDLAASFSNVVFSPTLMRGFDYYTGTVFEIFDTHPDNRRSLFGGGRYDDLLSLFSNETVPAFGFGMGDVTMRDFLETHDLLPEYRPATDIYLCHVNVSPTDLNRIAEKIRAQGLNVAVDYSDRKIGDQIKNTDKQKTPFIAVIGDQEIQSQTITLKNLKTGEEIQTPVESVSQYVK